jgi:glycosyltransferase involved in cell wall biosynthesis
MLSYCSTSHPCWCSRPMEGFGLPAVEAAARGYPVIATDQSPLASLLGGAAISIRPCQQEIERALELAFSSPEVRHRMSQVVWPLQVRLPGTTPPAR